MPQTQKIKNAMKHKHLTIITIVTLFLVAVGTSCMKMPDVIVDTPVLVNDEVTVTPTTAKFSGKYEYTTRLQYIWLNYGTSLNDLNSQETLIPNGNTFQFSVSGLKQNTEYFYCYRFSTSIGDVFTETKKFKTSGY